MDTQKICKYDLMFKKELYLEIRKRGLDPWKHNQLQKVQKRHFRNQLIEDDLANKKPIPYVECPNTSLISQGVLKS